MAKKRNLKAEQMVADLQASVHQSFKKIHARDRELQRQLDVLDEMIAEEKAAEGGFVDPLDVRRVWGDGDG